MFGGRVGMHEVTRIINAIQGGDKDATDRLLPLVYEELRRLAHQKLSDERPGQTLQATALVHEAYLRLVEAQNQDWNSRGHFFVAAAEAMRRILIENARKKKSLKRGGDHSKVDFDDSIALATCNVGPEDVLALSDALEKLAKEDNIVASLVKLRMFAGLEVKEAAEVLKISVSKAYADLEHARAWLRLEMGSGPVGMDSEGSNSP
jgi:RNA polymerase sigma factor (TIGR02999 family)